MKLNELIGCLQKCEERYGGEINCVVHNECHDMPCESIVPTHHKEMIYINFCEDDTKKGEVLYLS
jgi:hypothetical protein